MGKIIRLERSQKSVSTMQIHALPFVQELSDRVNFWSPPRYGVDNKNPDEWARATRLGGGFAKETIEVIRKTSFMPLLGWIAGAQVEAGAFDGTTVGFWHQISREL